MPPKKLFNYSLPPKAKSRRAAAIVIVKPAITSMNDIMVKNKKVESPLSPIDQGNTIQETRNATNTKVDKV